jgi:hypothetical protein
MPLDPLSNEDKKNDPNIYRGAPNMNKGVRDWATQEGNALTNAYNTVRNGVNSAYTRWAASDNEMDLPYIPPKPSAQAVNDAGADWGDGSQYTGGATYNTNGQQQNPYEMINEDNPFISGSLRTKQPTNPDEMPITYTQDEWGDTKATIMDQQGGVGSISYEGDPRSKGGSVTYTNMFSNALKEQQAKEAAAAAAQQQAAPASSVRSRIDALQKQLDKSRSIFDRRGHTLQEYRKAAALRKDLRQQIQDLQSVEQQEMRGQQAMDIANLQGQFGLQEAGIRNANNGALTQKDMIDIIRNQQKDQFEKQKYEEGKATEAAAKEEEKRKEREAEYADVGEAVKNFGNQTPEEQTATMQSLEGSMRAQYGDIITKMQNKQPLTQAEYDRIQNSPLAQQFQTLSQMLLSQGANEENLGDIWGTRSEDVPPELMSDPRALRGWQYDNGRYKFDPNLIDPKYGKKYTTAEYEIGDWTQGIPDAQRGFFDLANIFAQIQRGQSNIPNPRTLRQGQ